MSKMMKSDRAVKRFLLYTLAIGLVIFIGIVIIGVFSIFNGPSAN